MASIATVVTMGYGSFGSVNLLPTIGYGIASAAADTTGPWIAHESVTSFGTHASGYTTNPTVIRNTDMHQAYQADIDE